MTWNEWGFRLPLCTYRLNWARRTTWGWLDEWNDTALQRENSKFELWRYKAKHATSHGGSPKYWIFTSERGRKNCFFETWKPEWGWTRDLSIFQAGSFNHFTTVPPTSSLPIWQSYRSCLLWFCCPIAAFFKFTKAQKIINKTLWLCERHSSSLRFFLSN